MFFKIVLFIILLSLHFPIHSFAENDEKDRMIIFLKNLIRDEKLELFRREGLENNELVIKEFEMDKMFYVGKSQMEFYNLDEPTCFRFIEYKLPEFFGDLRKNVFIIEYGDYTKVASCTIGTPKYDTRDLTFKFIYKLYRKNDNEIIVLNENKEIQERIKRFNILASDCNFIVNQENEIIELINAFIFLTDTSAYPEQTLIMDEKNKITAIEKINNVNKMLFKKEAAYIFPEEYYPKVTAIDLKLIFLPIDFELFSNYFGKFFFNNTYHKIFLKLLNKNIPTIPLIFKLIFAEKNLKSFLYRFYIVNGILYVANYLNNYPYNISNEFVFAYFFISWDGRVIYTDFMKMNNIESNQ